MSVDVFGRNLKRSEGSRGPPGIGYKFTEDGQYDVGDKRLCNVADPQSSHDAVNLSTLIHTVELEIKKMTDAVSQLRNDLDKLNEAVNLYSTAHEEIQMNLNARLKKHGI